MHAFSALPVRLVPLVSALRNGLIAWRMSGRVRAILGSTQAMPCCRSSKCYRSSSIKF
ncbi:hypothetical protein V8C43DRAFT_276499 [Trichoderma afarasin]